MCPALLDPPVKTFYDFAIALTSMITKAGYNSDEIHIVFDNYREDSIKNGKRDRRVKSKEMIVLDVISPNQNVPVILENFWSSSTSKSSAFQAFYVEWLTTNYCDFKPLYLGLVYHHKHGRCWLDVLLYSLSSTAHMRKLMTG